MVFTSQKIKGYTLRLTVQEDSRRVAENATDLSYRLELCSTTTRFSDYGVGAKVLLDGKQVAFRDRYTQPRLSIGYQDTLTLLSGTAKITHASDGTKTLPVAFSLDMAQDDWTPGSLSVSGEMTLTPIARHSTIAATDGVIGGQSVITVNRKNAGYTHTVSYQFGSLFGYIGEDWQCCDSPCYLSDTGIAFSLPEEFYSQILTAASGKCTLQITTFFGQNQVGTPQSCTFTVQADPQAAKPVLSLTVADENPETLALTGDAGKLIRFASTARCAVTATGKFGATIEKITVNGMAARNGLSIPNIEQREFTALVTDSRGFTASQTVSLPMIPYCKLTVNPKCSRSEPTGSAVTVNVSGACYFGSFGAGENTLRLTCSVDGAEAVALHPTWESDAYTAQTTLDVPNYQTAHTLTVVATDGLTQVRKNLTLKQGVPVFDWGEKDFVFHVPVNLNGITAQKVRVWSGERTFFFQSKFPSFQETATARQSVLLCGTANSGNPVFGLLVINNKGTATWSGTGQVSAQKADETGGVTVTLPAGAYDEFMLFTTV